MDGKGTGRVGRARHRGRRAVLLACALLLAGPAAARTVTDARGRTVEIADTGRVVAIGGAVTEILYALGLADRIIAVDTTSLYPASALKDKPNVGYMRAISPEGVLALGPTLVVAAEGSGPPDAIKVLGSASVPFLVIPEAHDAEGVVARIRLIAEAMDVRPAGESLAAAVADDFAALAALRARITTPRTATFVLSAQGAAPVVGGSGSGADAILQLAGIRNAMSALKGYKPAVDEAMLAAEPEAIIVMRNGAGGLSDEALLALPAFAGTPAARAGRVIGIDGAYALGFGPRTPQAARDLAAALYPELALPALPPRPWAQGAGGGG
ncbi:MAG TPA: ABC transporter substrate-binding protein [Xanthobacteraceae bacterium]|nr:ABC transporter substrate-binding protein [Xanthobacteraceae bacterium]